MSGYLSVPAFLVLCAVAFGAMWWVIVQLAKLDAFRVPAAVDQITKSQESEDTTPDEHENAYLFDTIDDRDEVLRCLGVGRKDVA